MIVNERTGDGRAGQGVVWRRLTQWEQSWRVVGPWEARARQAAGRAFVRRWFPLAWVEAVLGSVPVEQAVVQGVVRGALDREALLGRSVVQSASLEQRFRQALLQQALLQQAPLGRYLVGRQILREALLDQHPIVGFLLKQAPDGEALLEQALVHRGATGLVETPLGRIGGLTRRIGWRRAGSPKSVRLHLDARQRRTRRFRWRPELAGQPGRKP